MSRLLGLGLVAGVLELLVDWALIHWVPTGRLVYLTGNDVVLLGSPIWMPLAWAAVITELGYPALRLYGLLLRRRSPLFAFVLSSVLTGFGAGVTVGFYEYFAFRADWWRYEPARAMLGGFCAWYIPLGEVFMFLPVIPIVRRSLEPDQPRRAATLESGAVFAVSIAVGYALAWVLLEFRPAAT